MIFRRSSRTAPLNIVVSQLQLRLHISHLPPRCLPSTTHPSSHSPPSISVSHVAHGGSKVGPPTGALAAPNSEPATAMPSPPAPPSRPRKRRADDEPTSAPAAAPRRHRSAEAPQQRQPRQRRPQLPQRRRPWPRAPAAPTRASPSRRPRPAAVSRSPAPTSPTRRFSRPDFLVVNPRRLTPRRRPSRQAAQAPPPRPPPPPRSSRRPART